VWKKIGEVAVDTGRIWVIDPCYIEKVGEDDGILRQHLNGTELGAEIATGAGDGIYDIMAKHVPNGAIAAIRIDFLDFESHGIDDEPLPCEHLAMTITEKGDQWCPSCHWTDDDDMEIS